MSIEHLRLKTEKKLLQPLPIRRCNMLLLYTIHVNAALTIFACGRTQCLNVFGSILDSVENTGEVDEIECKRLGSSVLIRSPRDPWEPESAAWVRATQCHRWASTTWTSTMKVLKQSSFRTLMATLLLFEGYDQARNHCLQMKKNYFSFTLAISFLVLFSSWTPHLSTLEKKL